MGKNDEHLKTIAELRAEVELLRTMRSNALTGVLSDSKIAKVTKHWTRDVDNLYIQVRDLRSRRRSWLFRWQDPLTGKRLSMGLGPYPTISIDRARELALFYRTELLEGRDPRATRDSKRAAILSARKLIKTFRDVVREWYDEKIAGRKPTYRNKVLNQLHLYICDMPVEHRRSKDAQDEHQSTQDILGDMPIQSIDTNALLDTARRPGQLTLRELWKEKWPTARDVLKYLGRIFAYAIRQKYRKGENPADWEDLLEILPPAEDYYRREPRESLPYTDLYRFLQAVRAYKDRSVRNKGRTNLSYAVEFIALTGVRNNEVLEAQFREIDLGTRTWNVPPQHRKGRKTRVRPIPITDSMVPVLMAMQKRRHDLSDNALIFPSDKTGRAQKTSSPSRWIQQTLKWNIKVTPHGFRSTLRDWRRAKTNFDDVLWKIQVDHKRGVDAADDAYGHDMQLDRRREMMDLYDQYSRTPPPAPPTKQPGKVLNLSDKRRTA